jgi:tRNA threonylcarbamoyladenosine biosynthesis protein TsaB
MRILAISTSTSRGSAAVLDGETVLGVSSATDLEGHAAERIFDAIAEALAMAGLSSKALEAFACDIGPGSFTGVRVGVSAGKGMALGRSAPLVGVGSLEAMAAAAFATGAARATDIVVAALDAKKQEVFAAGFDQAGALVWSPRHIPVASASSLILAGPGSSLAEGSSLVVVGEVFALDLELAGKLRRAPAFDLPDAATIGVIAARRLRQMSPADFDPALVEPLYVRPPDAKPMAETRNPSLS